MYPLFRVCQELSKECAVSSNLPCYIECILAIDSIFPHHLISESRVSTPLARIPSFTSSIMFKYQVFTLSKILKKALTNLILCDIIKMIKHLRRFKTLGFVKASTGIPKGDKRVVRAKSL